MTFLKHLSQDFDLVPIKRTLNFTVISDLFSLIVYWDLLIIENFLWNAFGHLTAHFLFLDKQYTTPTTPFVAAVSYGPHERDR
jgi:hypothetical protein